MSSIHLTKCRDCGNEISLRAEVCPHCGAPGPAHKVPPKKKSKLAALFWWLVIIVVVFMGLSQLGKHQMEEATDDLELRLENGEWIETTNEPLATALVKGGARGCVAYKYMKFKAEGEYLVQCITERGRDYYVVWIAIEEVMGPYRSPPLHL